MICRQLDILRWLRNPEIPRLPCPADFYGGMCCTAAARGDIEMLTWLRSEDCPWGSASRSAFEHAQLDCLFWMISQHHPCPWTGPSAHMTHNVLKSAIKKAARSDSESEVKAAFLDRLVISCLKALPCSMDHALLVAESGRVPPMHWLLEGEQLGEELSVNLFTIAAASNQVPMLGYLQASTALVLVEVQLDGASTSAASKGALKAIKWLHDQDPPIPFSPKCAVAASASNQQEVLSWLRENCPAWFWTESCCIAAVKGHKMEALSWLRDLQPACPLPDNACSLAAEEQWAQGFHWLRAHVPGNVWSRQEAADNMYMMVASGDQEHMSTLDPPCHRDARSELIDLCKVAAERGLLEMLRWLLSGDNRNFAVPAIVCQRAAMRDQPAVVQYLIAERPNARFPVHPERASDRCFIMLAKAGCPLTAASRRKLRELVDVWYVLQGLLRRTRTASSPAACHALIPMIQHDAEGTKRFQTFFELSQLSRGPPAAPTAAVRCPLEKVLETVWISPETARSFNMVSYE